MVRFFLLFILFVIVAQLFWRFMAGVKVGLKPPGSTHVPQQGVHMVRDPVCGTFVVPNRAMMLTKGSEQIYFCSDQCRNKYRASTA